MTDEQRAQERVQAIINMMLELDRDTRLRIYNTIGAFFGYDLAIDPDAIQPAKLPPAATSEQRLSEADTASVLERMAERFLG